MFYHMFTGGTVSVTRCSCRICSSSCGQLFNHVLSCVLRRDSQCDWPGAAAGSGQAAVVSCLIMFIMCSKAGQSVWPGAAAGSAQAAVVSCLIMFYHVFTGGTASVIRCSYRICSSSCGQLFNHILSRVHRRDSQCDQVQLQDLLKQPSQLSRQKTQRLNGEKTAFLGRK